MARETTLEDERGEVKKVQPVVLVQLGIAQCELSAHWETLRALRNPKMNHNQPARLIDAGTRHPDIDREKKNRYESTPHRVDRHSSWNRHGADGDRSRARVCRCADIWAAAGFFHSLDHSFLRAGFHLPRR